MATTITESITESFVIFLYADGEIQWTTGDFDDGFNGLNGTEALAGINAGDGVNHITIPGSLTPSIIDIADTSNVDIPGVWMFKVGEGTYICTYVVKHTCFVYLTPAISLNTA